MPWIPPGSDRPAARIKASGGRKSHCDPLKTHESRKPSAQRPGWATEGTGIDGIRAGIPKPKPRRMVQTATVHSPGHMQEMKGGRALAATGGRPGRPLALLRCSPQPTRVGKPLTSIPPNPSRSPERQANEQPAPAHPSASSAGSSTVAPPKTPPYTCGFVQGSHLRAASGSRGLPSLNTICNAQALHSIRLHPLHRTSHPSTIIPPSHLTDTLATTPVLQLASAQPAAAARCSKTASSISRPTTRQHQHGLSAGADANTPAKLGSARHRDAQRKPTT
ncbi:hypothetical protein G7Z17_g12733 [Cylindrodendrum hubeiense]|uniref:Uncharacterized protein n=1 Tax=Cylindrodendrum hubeiense TaxID=595255 RepID=A0A9P5GYC5_9HYPO|nr:hypothetical protein G7Z17_g12733 [Cylindrodendrum hubeiense]